MRHLREILHAAILAAPLGCGGSTAASDAPRVVDAAPTHAATPVAASVAIARPIPLLPDEPDSPACFTGLNDAQAMRRSSLPIDPFHDAGTFEPKLDRATGCPEAWGTIYSFELAPTLARRSDVADACCYRVNGAIGRALVDRGASVVARVRREAKDARARRWQRDGLAEHASIPSFLRAAEELRAVGAPASLIDGCLAGARDEARHAAACFALASRYEGRRLRPEPLPRFAARPGGVAMIARTTFVEAAVPETIAVLRAEAELRSSVDAEERDVLAMIVADEMRHAALAWQTLAWALTQVDVKLPALRRRPARVWREIIDPLLAAA